MGRVGDRQHQHNAELCKSKQSICLILRKANCFEMSIFVYNVVLDMLGLFVNVSKIFCLCNVYVS